MMSTKNETVFADRIAQLCFDHYTRLGTRGKPIAKQWTLLAAIVQSIDNNLSVVALATGTKCIGRNAMSPKGDVINDSHAEVLARRCFLRYLYDHVKLTKEGVKSDIFIDYDRPSEKCILRPSVEFTLFISHVPCGDASIIPKIEYKRKCTFSEQNAPKCIKLDSYEADCDDIGNVVDVFRTGAKCVGDKKDAKSPGVDYHIVGQVRTKPGRGDPTLSVSCSDKIARWIAVGLQGALLSLLIEEPVRLKHIVIAAGGPYSHSALQRAVVARTEPPYRPTLSQSSLVFIHSRYSTSADAKPCPTSIMWAKVMKNSVEYGVEGRRQGVTKKTKDKGKLFVCKLELFKKFVELAGERYKCMKYSEAKKEALGYQESWKLFKEKLGMWSEKPDTLTCFVAEV